MALLQHILNQDARASIQWNTLLVTQSAVLLYQRVGYLALATIHMFTPPPCVQNCYTGGWGEIIRQWIGASLGGYFNHQMG
jgi:hypothetical protein